MKLSSLGETFIEKSLYFCCTFLILAVYACLWQKVLKNVLLTTAFMFKSITVLYGMFFASVFFEEDITLNNILGVVLIVLGIIIMGWKS